MRVEPTTLGYKTICTPRMPIKATEPIIKEGEDTFESSSAVQNPSFKSKTRWGGALGCILGAIGGFMIAGPLGMVFGGATGAIGGDITHAKLDKDYPHDDYDSDDDYHTSYSSHYD